MSDWLYREGLNQPPAGELPSEWTTSQLSAACEVFGGGKLGMTKEKDYRSSGYPAFSAAGQDGFVERYEREADAVILSAIGANCGRCFPAKGRWATLANVQAIVPQSNRLHAGFLFNYVNRDGYWPRSGTAQPFIKPSDIGRCWVAHPIQTAEQSRIAEILATVDAASRETEAVVAKLRQVKAGLLHDLLTRGLDANGHLRDPACYPEQFQDSPLGRIPMVWEVRPIGDFVSSSAFGPRFSGELYHENGNIATMRTTDMDDQGNLDLKAMPLARLPMSEFESHLLLPKDVLVSRSGTCGITAVFQGYGKPVLPGAFLIRFRLTAGLLPEFLRATLNWIPRRQRLLVRAEGGVQKNLRTESITGLRLPFPKEAEQRQILGALSTHEERLTVETTCLQKLHSLKRGLAHDLLTGRVRVRD